MADRVVDEGSDYWLRQPLRDPHQWTENLARQIGIRDAWRIPASLHDTLLVVVLELDQWVREWPPVHDIKRCTEVAHDATKNVHAIELLQMCLNGPKAWRGLKVDAGCLQPALEKALAADIHRVVSAWIKWEIPKLRKNLQQQRDEAHRLDLPTAEDREAARHTLARARRGIVSPDTSSRRRRPDPRRIRLPQVVRVIGFVWGASARGGAVSRPGHAQAPAGPASGSSRFSCNAHLAHSG